MERMDLEAKLDSLRSFLAGLDGAVVAFSGGVDSALLSQMAHEVLGRRALAVTADSPSIPRRELEAAGDLAASRGWRHLVVETEELQDQRYALNPIDRCYWCKSALMDSLLPIATEEGASILLGTNLDDLSDHRPGQQAAVSAGALQPMVEAGLTKSDVIAASRLVGLPTADKPPAACLASRFAYGVAISAQGLGRVERAEEWMNDAGFGVVRVRDMGADRARVEVPGADLERLKAIKEAMVEFLTSLGFVAVDIDPDGYRRGALNEGLVVLTSKPS